jgi:thiol-disulfide isomerase/thioredoxin
MRSVFFAVALTLRQAVRAAPGSGLYTGDSAVESLADWPVHQNRNEPFALVEFYSSWCGHCQHFAPTYEAIAVAAKTRIPAMRVVAIECNRYGSVCEAHAVNGYPTLKLMPFETTVPHSITKRGADGVLDWVEAQIDEQLGLSALGSAGAGLGKKPSADGAMQPEEALANQAAQIRARLAKPMPKGSHWDKLHAQAASALRAVDERGLLGGSAGKLLQSLESMGGGGGGWKGEAADFGEYIVSAPSPLRLQPRALGRPVAAKDVLMAARYSLLHEDL